MPTCRFTVILDGLTEISDNLAEALFEAGCDDGSPWSGEGVAAVGFDRQAESFEQAVRSAIAIEITACVWSGVAITTPSMSFCLSSISR